MWTGLGELQKAHRPGWWEGITLVTEAFRLMGLFMEEGAQGLRLDSL